MQVSIVYTLTRRSGTGFKMSQKEGFWVRLWMERERSFKTEDTYEYLTYEDGYNEKNEDSLKSIAEDWARNAMRGYNSEYYRYDYEIVDKPPIEWLEKELVRLRRKQESLMTRKKLILSTLLKGNE